MRPTIVAGSTSATTSLAHLVEEFLDSCRARGLSLGTIERAYTYSLREVLLPWCDREGIADVEQLDQRALDRYTAKLLRDGGARGRLSPHTVHSYVRPVRQFLAWVTAEGERSSTAKPQLPRLPRRILDVLSREEIELLEGASSDERDKLIVRTLADTGVRVSEMCALRASDIVEGRRGRECFLRVWGKGDRERLVPLPPQLAKRLSRFLKHRRPAVAADDRIFISKRKSADGSRDPITRNGVLQLLRELRNRAGIVKRVHPHLFRHSFATEALRRGMSPMLVARVLGHTSLRMIENTYSHLNNDDAYDAVIAMLRA
jgi:site-specific recombinase XerD